MASSMLLGVRGKWEKRRHRESGNVFYFNTDKHEVKAFSYDPPTKDWVDDDGRAPPPASSDAQQQQEGGGAAAKDGSQLVVAAAGPSTSSALVAVDAGEEGSSDLTGESAAMVLAEAFAAKGQGAGPTPSELEELGKRQVSERLTTRARERRLPSTCHH